VSFLYVWHIRSQNTPISSLHGFVLKKAFPNTVEVTLLPRYLVINVGVTYLALYWEGTVVRGRISRLGGFYTFCGV